MAPKKEFCTEGKLLSKNSLWFHQVEDSWTSLIGGLLAASRALSKPRRVRSRSRAAAGEPRIFRESGDEDDDDDDDPIDDIDEVNMAFSKLFHSEPIPLVNRAPQFEKVCLGNEVGSNRDQSEPLRLGRRSFNLQN